jgi:hypothetical protein
MPNRFTFGVNRKGKGVARHYSLHTYATFEEARQAGQMALKSQVAAWERENAQDCSRAVQAVCDRGNAWNR